MKLTREQALSRLHEIAAANEDDEFPRDYCDDLKRRGWVISGDCSDGYWFQITTAGRAALAQGGVNDD